MPQLVAVDPSISKTPIPDTAEGLQTVCVLCSHNCGLRVDVADGKIVKVAPDEDNVVTHGYICNKGYSVGHYADHAQRVLEPLKRRADGSFAPIGWNQALTEIAEKLNAIRNQHGPRAVSLVGVGGQANHMDGIFALGWLGAIGSKRWFNAFAQEKTQHFLVSHLMFDAPPTSFVHPDIANTEFLLLIGTNPKLSNRGHNANETFRDIAKDESITLVAVDPRETETTRLANRHLKTKPAADAYFLLAVLATIVREELYDEELIRDGVVGFDDLDEALEGVDVAEMASRCGLSIAEIEQTARDFAGAEKAAIMWDLAVEHIPFSTLISYLIHVITTVTGNMGQPGGMIFMGTGAPPEWSPKRFEEPERSLASGIRSIAAIGGFPMFSPTLVPEEIMVDHPERIRAMIVEGANPYLSFSDTGRWREARKDLDLMVVIDPAMTETAHDADYVLPVPSGYEKWEWAGFPKGYPQIFSQLRPPVLPAKGDVLPEPEIYIRLGEMMGMVPDPGDELRALGEKASTPEGIGMLLGAIQQQAPNPFVMLAWLYRLMGPHLPSPALVSPFLQCVQNAFKRPEAVVRALGKDWEGRSPFELIGELFRRLLTEHGGTEIARLDPSVNLDSHMGWEDRKVRLAPEMLVEEIGRAVTTPLRTDPDYPLVLAAGLRTSWTANTIQRDPAWRKGRGPHCTLHISNEDADARGIADGDQVQLSTHRGTVTLPAERDKKVQPGHVWVPNGFGMIVPNSPPDKLVLDGVNLNELTGSEERDPITGSPYHKYTLCEVTKVAARQAAE